MSQPDHVTAEVQALVGRAGVSNRYQTLAMNATPFSLRIFVADGDPDGLPIVERSNWVGRALVFPHVALVYHT